MKYLLLALLLVTIVGEVLILVGLNIVDNDLHKPTPAENIQIKPMDKEKEIRV